MPLVYKTLTPSVRSLWSKNYTEGCAFENSHAPCGTFCQIFNTGVYGFWMGLPIVISSRTSMHCLLWRCESKDFFYLVQKHVLYAPILYIQISLSHTIRNQNMPWHTTKNLTFLFFLFRHVLKKIKYKTFFFPSH